MEHSAPDQLPILNISTDSALPETYQPSKKSKFQSFTARLTRLACGRARHHAKFGVIARYLIITFSMTFFTFFLLMAFRFASDVDSTTPAITMTNGTAVVESDGLAPVQNTDTAAIVVQLIWALSPLCATLFICFGSYKHIYAPISRSIIHDDDTEMNDNHQHNICYAVWSWKLRVYYHLHTIIRSPSASPMLSSAVVPLSSSTDDLHALTAKESPSSSPQSSPSSTASFKQRAPLVLPRFPAHPIFNRFNAEDHYPLLFASWFFLSVFVTSFASCFQWFLSVIFTASKWTSSVFILKIQNVLNISTSSSVSSSASLIIFAFMYSLIFGFLWDIFPPVSVDWGVGMGFSGCSWFLLAMLEETGWCMLLFPAFLNYLHGDIFRSTLYTGLLWSFWHYPAVLFSHFNLIPHGTGYTVGDEATPVLYALVMFTLSTISLRIMIVHLGLTTGTVWSGIIIHALHNVFAISFFAQLPGVNNSLFSYMTAEAGFVLVGVYCGIAAYIWKQWRETYVMVNESKVDKRAEYSPVTSKTNLIQLV